MLVRVVGYLRRNHLALIALFFAIGGTSYAAASLAPNSVGTRQLKNRSVTLVKIRRGAIAALRGDTGPRGPTGPYRPDRPYRPEGSGRPQGVNRRAGSGRDVRHGHRSERDALRLRRRAVGHGRDVPVRRDRRRGWRVLRSVEWDGGGRRLDRVEPPGPCDRNLAHGLVHDRQQRVRRDPGCHLVRGMRHPLDLRSGPSLPGSRPSRASRRPHTVRSRRNRSRPAALSSQRKRPRMALRLTSVSRLRRAGWRRPASARPRARPPVRRGRGSG